MAWKITAKQSKKYVDGGGAVCPWCGCSDIEGGPIQADGTAAWQKIECLDCGAEWNDIYRLVKAEPV